MTLAELNSCAWVRPTPAPPGGLHGPALTRFGPWRNLNDVKLVGPPLQPNTAAEKVEDPLLPLARLAAGGNRGATRQLVEAAAPAMLRAVRNVMGHMTAEVEDVLQESIEGLLGALATFKGECTVLHFACRVAVLSALASRRRTSFRAQFSTDAPDAPDATASLAPSPLEGVFANRRRQQLGQLLDELPPAQS
jgi:DNA-directed RNA polymerase specialized sigma24 family protein